MFFYIKSLLSFSIRKFKRICLIGLFIIVELIVILVVVEVICLNSLGCFDCCGVGCVMLEVGLVVGMLEIGFGGVCGGGDVFLNIGDEWLLDFFLLWGIIIVLFYWGKISIFWFM